MGKIVDVSKQLSSVNELERLASVFMSKGYDQVYLVTVESYSYGLIIISAIQVFDNLSFFLAVGLDGLTMVSKEEMDYLHLEPVTDCNGVNRIQLCCKGQRMVLSCKYRVLSRYRN